VGLPFFAAQFIQMMREDEAEAKVIDAELDARDAAIAASHPAEAIPGTSAAIQSVADDRPWWESDPRFANRFHAVDDGSD